MSRMSIYQSQQLDSIRAMAALMVLLGHTYQTFIMPTLNSWFTVVVLCSQFAVMTFFVLSGFLIGKSAYANTLRNSRFSFKQYAASRFLRLYPPVVAVLILMVLLEFLAPYFFPSSSTSFLTITNVDFVRSELVVSQSDILGMLTFTNGFLLGNPPSNSPLWSLSFEGWYYVIAGSLFLWPSKRLLSICLFSIVVFVTYRNMIFYTLALVWFSGFGLAMLHQRYPRMEFQALWWVFLLTTVMMIMSVISSLHGNLSGNEVDYDKINNFRLISGFWFACFLALLLGNKINFTRRLHSHAGYSYTLYVTHFPLMLFMLGVFQPYIYNSLPNMLIVSGMAIFVCIFFARFLSVWIEDKQIFRSVFRMYFKKKNKSVKLTID